MKYSSSGVPSIVKRFLKIKYSTMEENKHECWGLLQGSLAKSTWKRYSSALALWKTYAQNSRLNWRRIQGQGLTGFIGWCKRKRKISAGTVKIYLSSLKKFENLEGRVEKGGRERARENFIEGLPKVRGRKQKGKKAQEN
jgi:hypothetical protein